MYIVYETTNLIDGKYYIGVHDNDKRKNYLGSGIWLKRAIKLHGKENFMRETLREFNNKQDAYDYERSIVSKSMIENRNCYNVAEGGMHGGLGMIDKQHTEETKRKISIANTGYKNGFYGKTHCIETRQKMSISHTGKPHRIYSYHINNEIFHTSEDAGNYFNVHPTTITNWCKSPNKPNCHMERITK